MNSFDAYAQTLADQVVLVDADEVPWTHGHISKSELSLSHMRLKVVENW